MNGALGTHGYFIHGRPVPYCFWTENVRDEAFVCTEYTGVYHWCRKVQDVWFWLGEENCGRKVGDIPDSRSSTLGVTLSVQIQITIILGEKGVVRPPERHPRLDSGEKSHFFHPMHKPGIFRHTLSYYMTTMEIRFFTYRFLCRNINNSQLFKYQCYKRNVGQLLYGFQNKC